MLWKDTRYLSTVFVYEPSYYNLVMSKAGIDYVEISTPFYCNDGKGNFLLQKRSKNCRDEQGHWDTGGGELEFDLTLEENVVKEVLEEYGCKGEIQEQLPFYDIFREVNGAKTHWLATPFLVKVKPEEAKNNEPEKIDEIGWFKLNDLPEPLHTGLKLALKRFKDRFEKYR